MKTAGPMYITRLLTDVSRVIKDREDQLELQTQDGKECTLLLIIGRTVSRSSHLHFHYQHLGSCL